MLPKYLVYLIAVEEGYFPNLIAEVFREIFEISSIVSLDIIECHQLTLLLIWKLVQKNLIKNIVDWRSLTSISLETLTDKYLTAITFCIQILVVNDVHQINYNVLQCHLIHPVNCLVFLWARTNWWIRTNLQMHIIYLNS